MARSLRWVPVLLLAAGGILVGDSVVRGTTHAALVLIIPVLTGGSAEFLLGILLVFVGLVTLPWLLVVEVEEEEPHGGSPGPRPSTGGVILIGPVPIFFGEWRSLRGRAYLWWVALGSLLFLLLLVAALWWVLRG